MTNLWGDPRMELEMPEPVDRLSFWIGPGGSGTSAAQGVRILARSSRGEEWSSGRLDLAQGSMIRVEVPLGEVIRLEVDCRDGGNAPAWFVLDDLGFTRDGETVTLGFEGLAPGRLTDTAYGGLKWRTGSGFAPRGQAPGFFPRSTTARSAPPSAQPLPRPVRPPVLATAPTVTQEFFGQRNGQQPGTWAFPADANLSVGQEHLVSVVNCNITVYDKSGNQLSTSSMGSFFNAPSAFIGDPRVVYDPIDRRWVVVATDFLSRIYLAVSLGESPLGAWFKTSFVASSGADAAREPDYPTLGVDPRGITIGAYMIGPGTSMTIFAIDKAPLIATSPSLGTVTAFRGLPYVGAYQPAVHWEDAGVGYVLSTWQSQQLLIRKVVPPLTNPTLEVHGYVTVAPHNSPQDAPALGSTTPISLHDDRLHNAVYRNGLLYSCQTVRSILVSSGVRWYEVDPSTNQCLQRSTVRDLAAQEHYYFPAIAVNSRGDIALGFSGSSSTSYISAYFAGRSHQDPVDEVTDALLLRAGVAGWNVIDGIGRNRWGDYSGAAADPVTDRIWVLQAFAATAGVSSGRWRLRCAELEYPGALVEVSCQGVPNSTGSAAALVWGGGTSVAANDFSLSALGLPSGQFMRFFYGFAETQVGVANGVLCVGGALHRLPVLLSDPQGTSSWLFDVSGTGDPTSVVNPGDTVYFQGWYRDPAGGGAASNFTDAIRTTWVP